MALKRRKMKPCALFGQEIRAEKRSIEALYLFADDFL